jgi:hypothetical protein
MKYQFSIRIGKSIDKNSAATKAVLDCNTLLSHRGYKDYSLVFSEGQNKLSYYLNIFGALIKFYFTLGQGAIVAVQYPLLNGVFKYFIKAGKLKNVKIFCIIHDIESLRLGGSDDAAVRKEVKNLNYYDCLIVHNPQMLQWLRDWGITQKMVPLMVFDYLSEGQAIQNKNAPFSNTICFAGNLTKSSFIYRLNVISDWHFNVYGPNFQASKIEDSNVKWGGEFSPEQIVHELKGDFGLIWDGDKINECDAGLGSYLRYNNPHKFSLYLAAGIPVIAPADSAIGVLIKEYKIGILVKSLHDLVDLQIDEVEYKALKQSCSAINKRVTKGYYFLDTLNRVEKELAT